MKKKKKKKGLRKGVKVKICALCSIWALRPHPQKKISKKSLIGAYLIFLKFMILAFKMYIIRVSDPSYSVFRLNWGLLWHKSKKIHPPPHHKKSIYASLYLQLTTPQFNFGVSFSSVPLKMTFDPVFLIWSQIAVIA